MRFLNKVVQVVVGTVAMLAICGAIIFFVGLVIYAYLGFAAKR
jgi:hypothetical protein